MSDQPPPTPEIDKMKAVADQSQTIGEFLESSKYVLAEYVPVEYARNPQLMPVSRSIEHVLAEHFGIDLSLVENERRAILDWLRDHDPF